MKVRLAHEGDVLALARLNEPVQALHARLHPRKFLMNVDPAAVAAFFSDLIANGRNSIGICEALAGPAGYVWCEQRDRPGTPFSPPLRQLFVHHISVVESARRTGVGSELMRWVDERAREAGVTEVAVDYWMDNVEAAAFFTARGFASLRVIAGKALS